MIQSELYRNALSYAASLCSKDGKDAISADYFVAALLGMVLADDRAELAELPNVYFYNKDEARRELDSVRRILVKNGLNIMDVAVAMENAVRESAVGADCGEELSKIERGATARANADGSEELTAAAFLEEVLSSPTACVKKVILPRAKISAEQETTVTPQPQQQTQPQQPQQPQTETAATQSAVNNGDDIEAVSVDITFDDSNDKGGEKPSARPAQPQQRRSEQMPSAASMTEADLMERAKLIKDVQSKLLDRIFGQDLAVEMFVSGYFQAELVSMLMNKRKKPRATFLFAGPPGVGKTYLAECAAEVLGLPFKRFDMSEYSNDESSLNFAGTDKVYKGSHEGAVTGFVAKNRRSVLLFDEVEKAHINVIYLFLQMLDAGRLRDTFTEQVVDFSDTIIIFTTNAGRQLYNDGDIVNLSGVPKKTVLRAIAQDTRHDGTPFFPEAICSRFSAGNVVMFNRLDAHNLLKIADKEISMHAQALKSRTGVNIEVGADIDYAVLYSEGGNADARAVRGRAEGMFYHELYEFYRLASSDKNSGSFDTIKLSVQPPEDEKLQALFLPEREPSALVFANGAAAEKCKAALGSVKAYFADSLDGAKTVLAENDVSVIVCDVKCNQRDARQSVLNLEDIDSDGRDFFLYAAGNIAKPLYVLSGDYDISGEEMLSFTRNGAMGAVSLSGERSFEDQLKEKCNIAKQQNSMLELAKTQKILTYQTAQSFSPDGKTAEITLFDLRLAVAVDAEDSKNILSGVMRPELKFDDVIGAEDAKKELGYFTAFLKNPKMFAKSGVRPPKGILMYGPPGTGKTMLAKALAGESEVTFIAAEGNAFLKKYVGEGPALVHELFATARKYAPAVLFIDEIDAIGISRADLSAESDRTSNVLTAFLTEMDGFKAHPDKPVFVLAATNVGVDGSGKKQLDPALLRRFDRRILVDLPNKAEREKFLRMQVARGKNIKVSDAQVSNIAMRSAGMSLADLSSIVEMAQRDSLKAPELTVTDAILEEAFESYNSGDVKKWSDDTLLRTARHEAGHALLCWLGGETPSYLTIVARDNHGGYMQHADREDKQVYTKNDLLALVRTSLGGRAAELVYYGDEDGVTTGPSGDLKHATSTVEQLICTYGMDETVGLATIDAERIVYSPYYAVIRERTNRILAEQLELAKKAISDNRKALDKLVEELINNNKLRGEQIDEILGRMIKR